MAAFTWVRGGGLADIRRMGDEHHVGHSGRRAGSQHPPVRLAIATVHPCRCR